MLSLAAGVVCQRNSIPLSTMDQMIESKLSDTKWHLRGRVVAYAPHRIEEFVTAICMDCEPLKLFVFSNRRLHFSRKC